MGRTFQQQISSQFVAQPRRPRRFVALQPCHHGYMQEDICRGNMTLLWWDSLMAQPTERGAVTGRLEGLMELKSCWPDVTIDFHASMPQPPKAFEAVNNAVKRTFTGNRDDKPNNYVSGLGTGSKSPSATCLRLTR